MQKKLKEQCKKNKREKIKLVYIEARRRIFERWAAGYASKLGQKKFFLILKAKRKNEKKRIKFLFANSNIAAPREREIFLAADVENDWIG